MTELRIRRHPDSSVEGARRAVRDALRRARRRWFVAEWTRVGTYGAALLALALVAAAAVGIAWPVSRDALLATLLASILLAALLMAFIAWPLRRRPSDARVARYVEERCPELDDALASAADILSHGERTPLSGMVLREAAAHAAALDLDRVIDRSTLARRGTLFTAGLVGVLLTAWWAFTPLRPALDALVLRLAPGLVSIEVEPGTVSVAEGETVAIRARVSGLLAFDGPVVLEVDDGQAQQRAEMTADASGFASQVDRIERDTTYRVRAGGLQAGPFSLTVRRAPRVARIDVAYEYPGFTRLAARVQEDSGDIYAPAGSKATVKVQTTHPADGGSMRLASGEELPLRGSETSYEVPLQVEQDGSYRLVLRDSAGTPVADGTEYFIRVVDDRPPEVRIVRPAGDRRVTPLEELAVEVRADDDHGVDRLELVYASVGKPERTVALHPGGSPTTVSGGGTVYVEDLGVEPGDFITFYARARDVARGKRATTVQSDMFFLEVRPFSEEFQLAQSQAFQSAGGNVDDLAARQKEIVIATWKIERRAAAGRSRADIETLAQAQRELRDKVISSAAAASALRPARRRRGSQPRQEEPVQDQADDPLQRAAGAMEAAAGALEAAQPAAALPHEQEALSWLLKARADSRRRQIARQQSGGGGQGATGNEDLSALFDRELMRQQETNYESRSSLETRQESKESDALARLRELARRQDDLARRQQELARQASRMSQAEVRRQLERLTREQEELERALRAQAGSPRADSSRASRSDGRNQETSAVDAAREAMREANRSLQRGNVEEAARASARARERLSDATRDLEGARQGGAAGADIGELQLEAREAAEAARRLGERLGQQGRPGGPPRTAGDRESLADGQESLASRVDRLEDATSDAASRAEGQRGVRQAADELARQQLGDRLRREASALRQEGGSSDDAAERGARETLAVANALDAVAERLARSGGLDEQARRLSDDLARARATRERLEQLARRIDQASGDPRVPGGQPARPGGESTPPGRPEGQAGQQGRTGDGSEADRLGREFAREARQSTELMEALRDLRPELAEGLATLEGTGFSRSAPGTEAFKQDFAAWEALKRDVLASLAQLEGNLADRLAARSDRGRVAAGRDDRTTDRYRAQVDQYFRAIARSPRR